MKKLQKAFAMLVAVCMVMSMLSVNAFAAEKTSAIQIVEDGGKVYYLADPQEGDVAGEDNFDVWTRKTIAGTENEDEFEVTLQVGTTVKAVASNSAVVLLMDASGSMMADETGNRWYGNEDNMPADRTRRIQYTREAALEFAQAYVENAGGAKRMLSIVEFGNTAKTMLPWTNANDGGLVKESVEKAIESVEVNFTIDPARSYWKPEMAEEDFGKVDYWDASESDAVMVDFFESYFQDYTQTATMTSRFVSYFEADDSVCKYPECTDASGDHTHCAFSGCTVVEAHDHCDVEGCVLTAAHFHCTKCDSTVAHTHCAFDGCKEAAEHTHCSYKGCTTTAAHTHCDRCGLTSADHKHIVGCTLSGCEDPHNGPHIHACTYGSETIQDDLKYSYMYYPGKAYYGYRCKNPDPAHKHEVVDSDKCYLTATKYCGAVWATGTNMEAGMLLARNLVTSGLAEGGAIEDIDNVYVILLSDGVPTWQTLVYSTTETTQVEKVLDPMEEDHSWDTLDDIVYSGEGDDVAFAEDIKAVAELYAILYTSNTDSTLRIRQGHPLYGVSCADWIEKSGPNYVGADLTLKSPRADEIGEAFASFGERINLYTKAWIATEELSEHVTFEDFVGNAKKYAAEENGTISWNVGNMEPESGTGGMDDPYIYTLKYRVTLNSAEDEVREISLAHDANNTLDGVWTNEGETVLKYFMIKEDELKDMDPDEIKLSLRDATFTNVSVKGLYGGLSFIKKDGETKEPIAGVGFTLYDSENNAYGSEVFSDSEGKVTFTNIPRGEYSLVETAVPDGMQQMSDLEAVISWGMITAKNGGEMPTEIMNYPVGTVIPDGGGTDNPGSNDGGGGGTIIIPSNPTTPDVNIDEEDVPLGQLPEEEVEIGEEDVPLTELPEEDVPLAMAPATGDAAVIWTALSALSGAGLFLNRKKREDEE